MMTATGAIGTIQAADAVEPAYSAGVLLLIAAAAVALLLVLIMYVKMHAFVALVLVSFLTALATKIPLDEVVPTMLDGFGKTLASVALLVGLGAMIGRLLEVSGGAQVLADTLINRFGEHRAPLALGVASLLFGFPIFFDAGLVVMLPIIFSVARKFGGSVLIYGLPAAGAFAVMHAFVPPHPGPVAAGEILGADIGLLVLVGLLIGIPHLVRGVLPLRDVDRPPHPRAGSRAARGWRRRARGIRAPGPAPLRHGDVRAAAPAGADLPQHRVEHPRHRRGPRRRRDVGRAHEDVRPDGDRPAHHGDRRDRDPRARPVEGGCRAAPQRGARPGVRHHPHHRRRRDVRRRAARERHR